MNPCIFINRLSPTSPLIHFCPSSLDRPEQSWIKSSLFFCRYYIPFRVSILSWSRNQQPYLDSATTTIIMIIMIYRNNNNNIIIIIINNNRPISLNQVFYLDIIFRLPFPSCKPTFFNEKKTQPFTAEKISPKRGYVQTRIHRRLHDAVQELHDEVGRLLESFPGSF